MKLGRLLGVDVYIHFTFFLVLALVGLAHWLPGRGLEAALSGVLFFLSLFVCVLLHEFGHVLAARKYGVATRDITLLPIGGVARLERMPDRPMEELWVALAGPLVNVIIAGGLFLGLTLTGDGRPLFSLPTPSASLAERLLAVNVFLVLFNLLPAFPMDGGRVFRALLATRLNYARATRIAARVGQGMAVLLGFAALFGNPMLLLIALFVWIGAGQEALATEMKSAFTGARVGEAMLTDFRALSASDTVGDALRLLLAGSQKDFPVVENGRVVGVLAQERLYEALRARRLHAPVSDAMEREVQTVVPEEDLATALPHLEPGRVPLLPVLRQGRLIGLLTVDNLGEFFTIRSALNERSGPLVPPLPPGLRPLTSRPRSTVVEVSR